MKIDTSNFGVLEIDPSKIIQFKEGIPGFEDEKEFTIILNEDPENPFHYLQSINSGDLSFVIINPFEVFPEYEFEISEIVKEKLHIENEKQVCVYTIVTVPENIEKITSNLQAPIVINLETKRGKQVILDDSRYTTKHFVFNQNPDKGEV